MARVRSRSRKTASASAPLLPALLLAAGVGGGAVMGLQEFGIADWMLNPPARVEAQVAAAFPLCAGAVRATCVVDGDTFWLDGTKIRIADINTPETGQPSCAAEAELGRAATLRLAQLLGAGDFELRPADRDEDQYGRKLRIVERRGRSIGDILVAEGLAHRWQGRRESWC